MTVSDAENLALVEGATAVDALNSRFYAKYPFPWPPAFFERPADPRLDAACLNQSIGSWDEYRIPADGRIWIAGCGTNQAVCTALKYPLASIFATDLSVSSLEVARRSAQHLGLKNVTFECQSINDSSFRDTFDCVVCTGVVHHNAQPETTLRKLSAALRLNGVCELMVYNRYHRICTTALQKAVQILADTRAGTDFELEMRTVLCILNSKLAGSMGTFAADLKDSPGTAIADICMQPVEYSYTVESLDQLTRSCGLQIIAPCINRLNKLYGDNCWYLHFDSENLREMYDALPDVHRWQVNNLLLLERSPLLWFYLQRNDCERVVQTERQLCQDFLKGRFSCTSTHRHVYLRSENHGYVDSGQSLNYPPQHPDPVCQALLTELAHHPSASVESALRTLDLSREFPDVNRMRLMLTTCVFPYLVSQTLRGV